MDQKIKDGQYWQRVSASEATYTRGPKAQQMLARDISRCVTELRELERLEQVKDPIPTDAAGRVLDPDELALYRGRDSRERDGYLLMETQDYHDFEGCMLAKGWERVLHVPYDVADESRDDYLKSIRKYEYQSRTSTPEPEEAVTAVKRRENDPYSHLNN